MCDIGASPDDPDDPGDPVIRILLMGRKGSGKSSSGNTILGEKIFKVHMRQKKHKAGKRFDDVCEGKTQMGEQQVSVIDCPDLLDPDLNKERLEELKRDLVEQCSGGLSAVLLTVPLAKPVQNEEEILHFIKCLFGPEVQKYAIVLFTHEDDLKDLDEPQSVDEYVQNNDNVDFQQLLSECEKCYSFNNRSESKHQAKELLQKIKGMVADNGGNFRPDVNVSAEHPMLENKEPIRLILLGKTGCGKSATGNTIIGRNVFKSSGGSMSETKRCQSETTVRIDKKILVIDTPGLYDTALTTDEVITEIKNCITCATPGPHAFLIVIKVGRFTNEEKNTIQRLIDLFGEQILNYTMIIFTHKDQLEEEKRTRQQFVQTCDQEMRKLLSQCGDRFFFLDNTSAQSRQFKALISEIEKMVAENRQTYFAHDVFDRPDTYIKKMKRFHRFKKLKKVKMFYTSREKRKEPTQAELEESALLNKFESLVVHEKQGCCALQ